MRLIEMLFLVGPVLEAFGFQRIIFGSSPSGTSIRNWNAAAWYDIALESMAELGVEQQDINDVFSGNAQKVYGLT
jgi:predicted TIM-barrel fold metal-dependent hydrolase